MSDEQVEPRTLEERVSELERQVSRLDDVEEIKRLQARYAAVCDDRYNADNMVELFTVDGVWDGGPALGRVEGREALHKHFSAASKQFKWAVHFMIAPDIHVDDFGDAAAATWYLLEPATVEIEGRDDQYWLATVYDITYRREAGSWKFSEMKLNLRMWAQYGAGWGADGFGAVLAR